MPEFRHESTAVRTIAFMMFAAAPIPIWSSAAENGDVPTFVSFHGSTTTIRQTETT